MRLTFETLQTVAEREASMAGKALRALGARSVLTLAVRSGEDSVVEARDDSNRQAVGYHQLPPHAPGSAQRGAVGRRHSSWRLPVRPIQRWLKYRRWSSAEIRFSVGAAAVAGASASLRVDPIRTQGGQNGGNN